MEEERRSSSSDEEESSSSSGSSDDEIERSSNKRFKSDLISSLPDALIHHILSFLPSTKQAIRTGILSKRWRYQWTRVPVLVLYFSIHSYVPHEEFSQMSSDMQCIVIEQTLNLHDCAKIKKFHLQSDCYLEYNFTEDPVSFAVKKEVQELILLGKLEKFKLPNLVFNVPSLVRLQIEDCTLMPDDGRVNWKHLKDLHVERCCWSNQTIESVVSGSPLLESLEIARCDGFDRLVIASKSLKKLVLADLYVSVLQVSCPNLVEFYAMTRQIVKLFELSDGAIENLLSSSPLLERLELRDCEVRREGLVIDSKSLRKLFLADTNTDALYPVVISCPNIEELHLSSLNFERMKLMNLPSSVCVTIDYSCNRRGAYEIYWGKILEQLHDVKELNIGRCFLTSLSALEITGSGIPSPSINIKCMTFDGGPNFVENLPGIAYGLRLSPELEELVIISQQSKCLLGTWLGDEWPPDDVWVENHWKSNGTIFNCLESHLKIVKIFVLSEDSGNRNCVFNFLEFLLKNAKVLERMVIILENREADFVFEVSQKLLSFPRYSRHTMVELLCSESPRKFMHAYH